MGKHDNVTSVCNNKKCRGCREIISNEEDMLFIDGGYWHWDCYQDELNSKYEKQGRNRFSMRD